MTIRAGNLLVNDRYPCVVYLVCHLAEGGPSEWDFHLVKIIDRSDVRTSRTPLVCNIGKESTWHTSDDLLNDKFRKIGHLDLSTIKVDTSEKS